MILGNHRCSSLKLNSQNQRIVSDPGSPSPGSKASRGPLSWVKLVDHGEEVGSWYITAIILLKSAVTPWSVSKMTRWHDDTFSYTSLPDQRWPRKAWYSVQNPLQISRHASMILLKLLGLSLKYCPIFFLIRRNIWDVTAIEIMSWDLLYVQSKISLWLINEVCTFLHLFFSIHCFNRQNIISPFHIFFMQKNCHS